jgi:hypothetical protein
MGTGINFSKIVECVVLTVPQGVSISKVVECVVLDTVHLISITVTPATKTLKVGETQQYTATGTYNNSTTQDLTSLCTFTSSDTDVVTIASGGLATAVDDGEVTITATYDGISGTATLDVISLESIYLTPSNTTITEGDSQQYVATGVYSDASEVELTAASCTWTSSNTTVATIDSSGFAVSLADGQTTITATYLGVSGNTTLTVGAAVVAEVATRLFGIVSFATADTYRDATYLSKRYEHNPNSIGVMQVLATKYPVTVDLVFPDIPYTITSTVTSKKPVRVKGFLMEAVEVRVNPLEGVTAVFLASTMEELPI